MQAKSRIPPTHRTVPTLNSVNVYPPIRLQDVAAYTRHEGAVPAPTPVLVLSLDAPQLLLTGQLTRVT